MCVNDTLCLALNNAIFSKFRDSLLKLYKGCDILIEYSYIIILTPILMIQRVLELSGGF